MRELVRVMRHMETNGQKMSENVCEERVHRPVRVNRQKIEMQLHGHRHDKELILAEIARHCYEVAT